MKKGKNIIIVMPAYNAAKTLQKTFNDIPKGLATKVILVDDGSHDNTVAIAKKLGIDTYIHPQNRGYGANQKTLYTLAFNHKATVVVMIHPDYQYDSSLTQILIDPILSGRYDLMLGSRIRTRQETLAGGMPIYKYIGNRFLTLLENTLTGSNLSEYHTGFRAYHIKVLKTVPFHKFSDNFIFDQQIIFSALKNGFKIGEIHVPTRYNKDASSINFWRSSKYGLETVFLSFSYFWTSLWQSKSH